MREPTPTPTPRFIGHSGHSGFTMHHNDKPGEFRSWCICECGWVSADIIGREGAYIEWKRHIDKVAAS